MVKRVSLIAAFLILCLATIGCGEKKGGSTGKPLVFEQIRSGFTAQFTISRDPVPVMKETSLTLALHDADGQPVRDVSVRCELTMPGMTMPPNQPKVNEKQNGVYETKVIVTMAGDWRCRAQAEIPGGTSLEFTFDFRAR
jgi:hypothetical protein